MKKSILSLAMMAMSVVLMAAPAKLGFREHRLQDGTTVSLQLVGDEFGHWYEDADGRVYIQNAGGTFAPAAATRGQMIARRKASPRYRHLVKRRAPKFGDTPNLAPKGVVILVNFSDAAMQASHTLALFDEFCNSTNCTVNSYNGVNYGSAAQFFADQSKGVYRPQFDVFGPVTLSHNYAFYGENEWNEDAQAYTGEDKRATDAVIEACIIANQQYSDLDFSNYDADNDGNVDFVYIIYAGKGEADGGGANTIWPHNWLISYHVNAWSCNEDNSDCWIDPENGTRKSEIYTEDDVVIDGKVLDNYAMSAELKGNGDLSGIGTLCHEFSHVLGLTDVYDTDKGEINRLALTPADWNLMGRGNYNLDGHCPPNYDPWQKYFFGWVIPVNPGNEGAVLTLQPNGTSNYQPYQINASGTLAGATESGVNYFIENRQNQGWDRGVTGHGMLLWRVDFDSTAWNNNAPNSSSTSGAPLHTIVSAYGTMVGLAYTIYDSDGYPDYYSLKDHMPQNTFPGTQNVTSYTGIDGKPLLDITENNGLITLTYIEDPAGTGLHDLLNESNAPKVVKAIRGGQVIIIRNGVEYDLLGIQL